MMLLLFSLIGAAGSILLPVPQAIRAYKVSTDGVSLATYLGLFTVAIIWIPHGIFHDVPLLSISNFIATFFIFTVLYSIARDKKNYKIILYSILMAAVFLTAFLIGGTVIRVMITTGLSVFLRLPQLQKSFMSKNIDGISVNTWIISGLCNAAWFCVGTINKDVGVIAPTAFNTISSFTIVGVTTFRRKRMARAETITAAN